MYYLKIDDLMAKLKEKINKLSDEEKIGYEKCISDIKTIIDDAKKNHELKHQF